MLRMTVVSGNDAFNSIRSQFSFIEFVQPLAEVKFLTLTYCAFDLHHERMHRGHICQHRQVTNVHKPFIFDDLVNYLRLLLPNSLDASVDGAQLVLSCLRFDAALVVPIVLIELLLLGWAR